MKIQEFLKTDFRRTDFSGAELSNIRFLECDFRDTKFTGTTLKNINFQGCLFDIYRCKDYAAIESFRREGIRTDFIQCNNDSIKTRIVLHSSDIHYPVETDGQELIAYKKIFIWADTYNIPVIAKLNIPAYAERIVFKNSKCRASCAQVMDIIDEFGRHYRAGVSSYDFQFEYNVGHMVYADSFDDDPFNVCSNGIHFFLTEREAQNY